MPAKKDQACARCVHQLFTEFKNAGLIKPLIKIRGAMHAGWCFINVDCLDLVLTPSSEICPLESILSSDTCCKISLFSILTPIYWLLCNKSNNSVQSMHLRAGLLNYTLALSNHSASRYCPHPSSIGWIRAGPRSDRGRLLLAPSSSGRALASSGPFTSKYRPMLSAVSHTARGPIPLT